MTSPATVTIDAIHYKNICENGKVLKASGRIRA